MLSAMDNAVRACDRRDLMSQAWLEDLRNMLKPELDWAHRYGEWPSHTWDEPTDADLAEDLPDFEVEDER